MRKAKGKYSALIYDLVVQPQLVQFLDPKEALIEKRLMENELKRVYEFASLAENRSGILQVLRPLMAKYQIDYGVKE